MKTGADRIAAERKRQIEAEGWTAEHDDEHDSGELPLAAACYSAAAAVEPIFRRNDLADDGVQFVDAWPGSWADRWDKRPRYRSGPSEGRLRPPSVRERIRMLEKAGALIAAEIDRLLRPAPSGAAAPGKEE